MANLFEMLVQSQNGRGVEVLARQFGLTQQQAQQAVEALLPAFSQGLRQNAADPYGIGAFMGALASGQHARYYDEPAAAFTPQGMADGNGILGHLFGSKDLSRAVASQAAQATGIGQDVLKQMLPALAAMIMGGMFRQSTTPSQPGAGAANPFGDILNQMMRQGGGFGGEPRQASAPGAGPFDNPFGKALQDMFGGAAGRSAQQGAAPGQDNPFGGTPWGQILEGMLGGQAQREPAPEPQATTPRREEARQDGRAKNPYDDIFGDMFESGRRQRDDYQKGMESIFEQFSKGMDRFR